MEKLPWKKVEVEVNKDLSLAKIYFTSISELSHKDIEKEDDIYTVL